MKKGILKNPLFLILATISAGMIVGGIVGGLNNVSKEKSFIEEKKKIISDFKVSQRYSDIILEKRNIYNTAFNTGALTLEEYNDKLEYILSDRFAEECILAEGNLDAVNSIDNLNEKIGKYESGAVGGTISCIGGFCFGAFAGLSILLNKDEAENDVNDLY